MDQSDISLSEATKALCKRLGVPERAVKEARAGAVSNLGGNEYLILLGTLPDGRSVQLKCRHDLPTHVVTFRPLP